MDLLTSDAGPPRPARARPELPAGGRAVALALAAVLLAGLASLALGDSAPDAGARVPTALPAGEIPGTLLVVGDTGTSLVERADPPRELLDEPLRESRQLAGGVVVGLADGAAVAVTPGSATTLGPADYWVPSLEPDEVWLVRGSLAHRYDVTGRQLGYRPVGDARLRGEIAAGLVVDDGERLKVLDTRGLPARILAESGRALDVAAGRIVRHPVDCLTCPLQIDDGAGARPLPETADPGELRNLESVRLSPDGRFLAYVRLLGGQIGNPVASYGQVVVVDVETGRLQVVPRSDGTEFEAHLTWTGATLSFVRRLGGRLVVARVDPGSLRSADVPSQSGVDDVIGAFRDR